MQRLLFDLIPAHPVGPGGVGRSNPPPARPGPAAPPGGSGGPPGRRLEWWYFSENSRFGLSAELPAAEGAVVARCMERLADSLPVMPGEEQEWAAEARRADALVALCSSRIAQDPDPDRATVVVHVRLDRPRATGELLGQNGLHSCEIEGGPAIPPEIAERLACNGRIQLVLKDGNGRPVRLGRITREPPDWMLRQLRYRDRECTFRGCGSRRFTQAHHVVWWERGGPDRPGQPRDGVHLPSQVGP